MSDLDTNIDNWSIDDLLDLFGLTEDNQTTQSIEEVSGQLIESSNDSGNDTIAEFIKQARDKLMENLSKETEDPSFAEQATQQLLEWRNNQFITQSDSVQSNKTTSRNNKVQTFDDGTHFQMKREQLGVNQSYPLPIMQGTINPNLKNIVERTVLIDSQYRPNILPYAACDVNSPSYNTNLTVDLSDPLQNVISMELYSIQIPQSWANISSALGNNMVQTQDTSNTMISFTVPDGFYTIDTFFSSQDSEGNPSRTLSNNSNSIVLTYNTATNRVKVTSANTVVWYSDNTIDNSINSCYCVNTHFINNNLGWLLGFRNTDSSNNLVSNSSETADAVPNFSGPQYFLLSVDDYQQNRLNKSIISTVDRTSKLDMPDYTSADSFTPDATGNCVAATTAPRQLTQAQLYTINTIYSNRKQNKTRPYAPTTNNVLSVIPLPARTAITSVNTPLVLFGVNFLINAREYFGPVTIERLGIKLVDDKGNLVDLNGLDWSFVFRVKQLYQY
jgi:hypothetical protein